GLGPCHPTTGRQGPFQRAPDGAPGTYQSQDRRSNMIRAKMLAIFAGMLATLAVSAVPAFAEFTSKNGKASGPGKPGPVVLEGGDATLECSSAEGKGTILNASGVEALKGPTLSLNTEK